MIECPADPPLVCTLPPRRVGVRWNADLIEIVAGEVGKSLADPFKSRGLSGSTRAEQEEHHAVILYGCGRGRRAGGLSGGLDRCGRLAKNRRRGPLLSKRQKCGYFSAFVSFELGEWGHAEEGCRRRARACAR